MSIKVQNDAMAQDGGRDGTHIVNAQVKAPAHQRKHATTLYQSLRATRRTAIPDIAVCDLGRIACTRLGGHNELDSVVLHVRRDDHLLADGLQLRNLSAIHDLSDIRVIALRGDLDDAIEIIA